MRELAQLGAVAGTPRAVLAPWGADSGLREAIAALRANGEIVIEALPGHEGTWQESDCDRRLVSKAGSWVVEKI
ncbi:MAG: hypothetical protein C0522_02270 [Rhodocyclaceae bacterium]|nr:hypothetical protein [Rhodocyclaceae bacterium]